MNGKKRAMIYGPKNDGTYIVEFRIAKRKWLRAIIHEGDAEAVVEEKQEKALAEHVTRHPEDAGRTVEDFKWILRIIVRPTA